MFVMAENSVNFTNMNLTHVINDIVTTLANWETAGLNEAQTRQVIVLRLFSALGYNIWNPFEVIAERNSGGGAGGYIPDFTMRLDDKDCFIVEVKTLGKEFSNNDRTQAVNYVNSMGLRWAILTNGKQWLFFDNKQEGVATDRLVMTIDLTTSYAADHLEKLLAPAVWRSSQANQTVWEVVQFLKLESKLRQIMQRGFTRDRDGLEMAIELKLPPDERQLAESHFEELYQRILSVQQVVSSTSPVPTTVASAPRETSFSVPVAFSGPMVVKSQTEILQLLREKIEMVSQANPTHRFDIAATLNDVEIKANSWRNTFTGIAEVFVSLGREQEIQGHIFDSPEKEEDGYQYRQLSNGKYLRVDWSAKTYRRYINKWLKKLQVPLKVLALTYKDETYYLPSPVSTSVASPSRDAKETASPSVTSSKPAVVKSQTEILQLLREKIEQVTETFSSPSRESRFTEVKLDGVEIKAKSWPDILTGLAETFIGLGRMVEIQNHIFISDSPEKRESGYRYRQLSNDKYLRIDWSAGGLIRHINKWLRKLQLPLKVLAVTYRDETYYLPSPISTSVASPSRDAKETASPSVTSSKPAVVKSQTEILQLLREKIEMVSQNTSAYGFDITAKLNGVEIRTNTWRNVFTGIAETFIGLGREKEIQKYIFDSAEQKKGLAYRQLSNGKYLLVNFSANDHQKHINRCLKILQLSPEILAVTYRGETYCLPM